MRLSTWAFELARNLLAADHALHWDHTTLAAMRAEVLGMSILSEQEREVLCAAVWLHRAGVHIDAHVFGFVPLDSARYIASRTKFTHRVASLVAHQSAALYAAEERRIACEMVQFPDENSLTRDAFWFCLIPTRDHTDTPEITGTQFGAYLGDVARVKLKQSERNTSVNDATSRVARALAAKNFRK